MLKKIRKTVTDQCLNTNSKIMNFMLDCYVNHGKRKITFRHYDRQHQTIIDPLKKELNKILNFSTDFESELYVRRFENNFAKLCGTKFAIGTHSGTAALQFSLIALDIGIGDEVITVPNTYIATALAISNTGAKPVFVDVDKDTFNISVEKIEDAITEKTKAIMPVHLYGQMADMGPINKIAKRYNLKVIEDACQSFGAEYKGKKAGSIGDCGCFSFFTSKNISGLGNGGLIVSNDKIFTEKTRLLRDPESNIVLLRSSKRTPCYLDAFQVAFLKAKLPYIQKMIKLRRKKAKLYNELLHNEYIMLPKEHKNMKHTYYSYVIKTKQRDKLKSFLNKKGIETQIEYLPPIHLSKTFKYLGYKKGSFPITEKLTKEILSLPISPFLEDKEIEKIVSNIKSFF